MLLRSRGPVDQLDTTQLNPAGCYIRSYNKNGQSNVNASYNTVSLQIKEKRRQLVFNIVAILGNDPRGWFESSLRLVALPVRPLDWSTTLLQQLCVFAQSLPCDLRSTTVGQRLSVAWQKMLAETSGSHDCSANGVNTQQTNGYFQKTDERDELYQHLVNKVQAMQEEIAELVKGKKQDVHDIEVLENRLKNMPDSDLEVLRLRERISWLAEELDTRREQASNDQMQAAIFELQRALGFY